MYKLICHSHCHKMFLRLRRKSQLSWKRDNVSGGGMMRRDQEPPGERREVIVNEKMEEPSASWEMKTGLGQGKEEREREVC